MVQLLKTLGALERKGKMTKIGSVFVIFMKLMSAAVIFVLFYSMFDGLLRWLGLLGIIPLILAFSKGCNACMLAPGKCEDVTTWPSPPPENDKGRKLS